jgi:hypothetical protein
VDKKNIKKEMKRYIKETELKCSELQLITEGYWCKSYYIESEGRELTINVIKGRISGNNSDEGYFKVEEVVEIAETSKEMTLGGGITKQVAIEWNHSVHGVQIVKMNMYANPQVGNGMCYKSRLYNREESKGLMVHSAPASTYELKTIRGGSVKSECENRKLIR